MGNIIDEEIKLMNFKDGFKLVADGVNDTRSVILSSTNKAGYKIKVEISGAKESHPFSSYTSATLLEIGLFDLIISEPKEKQVEITDFFEDEDE